MSKLIDAEKLKDAVKGYCKNRIDKMVNPQDRSELVDICRDVDDLIDKQPTEDLRIYADWVRVKDRPPKQTGMYLCVCLEPDVNGGGYKRYVLMVRGVNNGTASNWDVHHVIVTHYVPLPELPKEENNDKD